MGRKGALERERVNTRSELAKASALRSTYRPNQVRASSVCSGGTACDSSCSGSVCTDSSCSNSESAACETAEKKPRRHTSDKLHHAAITTPRLDALIATTPTISANPPPIPGQELTQICYCTASAASTNMTTAVLHVFSRQQYARHSRPDLSLAVLHSTLHGLDRPSLPLFLAQAESTQPGLHGNGHHRGFAIWGCGGSSSIQ